MNDEYEGNNFGVGLIMGLVCGIVFMAIVSIGHAETTLDLSFGPSLNGTTNPKYASLAIEKHFDTTSIAAECGAIFEYPVNGVCAAIFSARVKTTSGFFMKIGAGPAYVFQKDGRVSSNWNAMIEAALGIEQNGWAVGVKPVTHISNAGLAPPNLGRDWALGYVEIGL